jgi:hypothetical protein
VFLNIPVAVDGSTSPSPLRPPHGKSSAARSDEPGFPGEDDELDTIAEGELREDVGDVALDGRLAEVHLLRDPGVREAALDERQARARRDALLAIVRTSDDLGPQSDADGAVYGAFASRTR